ncbi:MAG: hypothetical protein IJ412_03345 [Oscillospiraceae bacterium]|nr:hypothetical protein [Oscillospiraceae bacterium]
MKYSVEDICGGIAALSGDDGSLLYLCADQLPADTVAGDILEQQPDSSFRTLPQLSRSRADRAMALFRKLARRE